MKGPGLTLLNGKGNDFDQASLMIALLRESGFTADYVYGTMSISAVDVSNWLGVDNDPTAVGNVIASGGIPVQIYVDGSSNLVRADMDRVWVKANINGTDYVHRRGRCLKF